MGAHLLTLAELSPTLSHLLSAWCARQLAQTHLGAALLPHLRALAEQVEAALDLPELAGASAPWDDIGDLAQYPGYAALGSGQQPLDRRGAGAQLWSRLDPTPPLHEGHPRPVSGLDRPAEPPLHGALREQVVSVIADLRLGLRIEGRYRGELPEGLDGRLFAPLDDAIQGRRAWIRAPRVSVAPVG